MKTLIQILCGMLFAFPTFAQEIATPEVVAAISVPGQDTADPTISRTYYYNFGYVPVNMTLVKSFYIRNSGNSTVRIRQIYIQGMGYAAWSHCPQYLPAKTSCRTDVQFRPWRDGYHWGLLSFRTTGGNVEIELSGYGYY